MTNSERGRLGGQSTLRKYGSDHFRDLALRMVAKHGKGHMADVGHLGGERYVELYVSRPSYWHIPRGGDVRR